jgi:hypothetical protein
MLEFFCTYEGLSSYVYTGEVQREPPAFKNSVLDPNPDWIRIQSDQWIRTGRAK